LKHGDPAPFVKLTDLAPNKNKQTDLAPHVGASLAVMKRDAAVVREGGPTIFASVRHNEGVNEIKEAILSAWGVSGAKGKGKGKQPAR
jgi:urease accessory protein